VVAEGIRPLVVQLLVQAGMEVVVLAVVPVLVRQEPLILGVVAVVVLKPQTVVRVVQA